MLSFTPTIANEWNISPSCLGRCAPDAASCLQDGECLVPPIKAATTKWRVVLEDEPVYYFSAVTLFPWVETLEIKGNQTRVMFDSAHRWLGTHLTAVTLMGLNLTATSLPPLPQSLVQLHLIDCRLNDVPVAWLLSLSSLETLVLENTFLTDPTKMLMKLSEPQYKQLKSRLTIKFRNQEVGKEVLTECTVVRGRIESLSGYKVCVVPAEIAVTRRLQTFASSLSSNNQEEDANPDESRVATTDHDMPTLVLISLAVPFIYFLFKFILFMTFMRGKYRSDNTDAVPAIDLKISHSDGQHRPTMNESTASFPFSPGERAYQSQSKSYFGSNNVDFWVDEELQQWRLDFHRLKMLKWLNMPPNEKRQTLRRHSVTNGMHPREIWLASLLPVERNSLGGLANETLVVAKYLPPTGNHGQRRTSTSARDKLRSEVKRQAQFFHPQVVTFVGVAWSRDTNLVALTEYMTQGDLRQWLRRTSASQSGTWTVCKLQMLLDVISALHYMHSVDSQVVHGNCNSRNVLLNDSLRAKLSDFGVESRADGLTDQELLSYSAVGSGRWMSPEALLGRESCTTYADASDVYSFGILMAEVDSHELPFSDLMQANRSAVPETDILQLIARGALSPTLSSKCPNSIVKLVNACTSYQPKHRPRSKQVQEDLLRILEDFREVANNTMTTVLDGVPCTNQPSHLV